MTDPAMPMAPENRILREGETPCRWKPCCGRGRVQHRAGALGHAYVGSPIEEWVKQMFRGRDHDTDPTSPTPRAQNEKGKSFGYANGQSAYG
jgi:hypothetical protein